jgi:leucyl aminopeptidase
MKNVKLTFENSSPGKIKTGAFVFFTFEDEKLLKEKLNRISILLKVKLPGFVNLDHTGKNKTVDLIYTGNQRLLICGLGKKEKFSLEKLRKATARAVKKLKDKDLEKISVEIFNNEIAPVSLSVEAEAIASLLSLYSFDKYYTSSEKKNKNNIRNISFFTTEKINAKEVISIKKYLHTAFIIASASNFARDLGNEPSNILYPDSLAVIIRKRFENSKCRVEYFDKRKLTKMGMNAVLEVAKGSRRNPGMLVLKYNGSSAKQKPVVLVGKGVTFDSGGISIKPSAGMAMMKLDMGGASAVLGTFDALVKLNVKKNLIGLIPLVENMPDGNSYKPGDVITAYDGKTIEIDNTDAEGRLILADAVAYAAEFNPEYVIDLATLTGAAIIALGHYATIAMGNDDKLVQKIIDAGEASGERVWQLPLWDEYDNLIDSDIADVRNSGKDRSAGTIIGGMFVKRFVKDFPWVHLDIAGTGMLTTGSEYIPKYATGVGVRLLTELLARD